MTTNNIKILQGTFLSDLIKYHHEEFTTDYDGTNTIKKDKFKITLENNDNIQTSTVMFLTYILHKLTIKGVNIGNEIVISMEEYQKVRNITMDKVRDKVKEDMKVLKDMTIECYFNDKKQKGKNNNIKKYFFKIFNEDISLRNKYLYLNFNNEFLNFYEKQYLMNINKEVFSIDVRKNPNSFNLAWKISQHARMNFGKPNQNVINTPTLLEFCPTIPKYTKELRKGGQLFQRIINPFERDLNRLDFIDWYYLNENGEKFQFTDKYNYGEFVNLKICINWKSDDWCANYKSKTTILNNEYSPLRLA